MSEELEQKLAAAEARAEDNMNGWKRAKADYLNLKRDAEKEKMELVKFANLSLLFELLPLADHFELALNHVPENEKNADWVKGIVAIQKQLEEFLRTMGLERFEGTGVFTPELHEAIEHVESDSAPDTILETMRPGYKLHGTLIRPAQVKVAKEFKMQNSK